MITLGAVFSTSGNNMGQALSGSRNLFALAEQGDLPPFFGRVHPTFRTPVNAILVTAGVALALALSGSFRPWRPRARSAGWWCTSQPARRCCGSAAPVSSGRQTAGFVVSVRAGRAGCRDRHRDDDPRRGHSAAAPQRHHRARRRRRSLRDRRAAVQRRRSTRDRGI